MVKLTEQQRRELEALRNMSDDEIDLSDIPEITDWSRFRIAPFYRPNWNSFQFKLASDALECLKAGLKDGQTLDEAINKALRAQMFRIRFPVRVEKAEKTVRMIQESPEETEKLFEIQKQEIEILYSVPFDEVASGRAPLVSMQRPKIQAGPGHHHLAKYMTLRLDENIIDWFEYRLEDGQSLDDVISTALAEHIRWIQSSEAMQQKGKAGDPA
jgi:uncharacterized protein (DUF4415 family)